MTREQFQTARNKTRTKRILCIRTTDNREYKIDESCEVLWFDMYIIVRFKQGCTVLRYPNLRLTYDKSSRSSSKASK